MDVFIRFCCIKRKRQSCHARFPPKRHQQHAAQGLKVAGQWKYLYRGVDREGETVDFLLTAKRDRAAARRFLERAIKRITRPILGFKSFWSARIIIVGIETMHMIKKVQMQRPAGSTTSTANPFYSLAA